VSAQFSQAQISVVQTQDIIDLVDQHKAQNKAKKTISGWSVQLLASSERAKVTELKGVFLNTYPNVKVDWDYSAPYYKLKAGAYLTKMEATRLLYRIKNQFPDAYVVRNSNLSPVDLL
jgi:hypothetical protein